MTHWTFFPAAGFADHADQWQQLNLQGPASPLFEPDFVRPLLAEFGTGKELLAIGATAQGVVAMAILTPNRAGAWETFQPSQAPLGMWMNLPGQEVGALLDALVRGLPGLPLVVGLTQCDPWLMPRPSGTATLQTVDYVDTARITIRGSFDEYWNTRGRNLRSNLKKQRARLGREGIVARMEVLREPQQMAAAVAEYGRIESAGWKAELGTAIHPDNAQGRFYTAMLEGFCRRGAASVTRYFFNDKVVAMDMSIEGNGCMIVLKTTYDETVPSHFSPAFLMREETCQQLFAEQKFETLEFYGKVMEWHRRWTDEVRTLYHVNNYRWPILRTLHTIVKNRAGRQQKPPATAPAALPASQDVHPTSE